LIIVIIYDNVVIDRKGGLCIEKQLGEHTRELLSIPVQRSTKRKNEPER
jgi:hypothetical protein